MGLLFAILDASHDLCRFAPVHLVFEQFAGITDHGFSAAPGFSLQLVGQFDGSSMVRVLAVAESFNMVWCSLGDTFPSRCRVYVTSHR